jgi:hypothetical protein
MAVIIATSTDKQCWTDTASRTPERFDRPAARQPATVQTCAKRCQHLNHAAHHIVDDLTAIQHDQPTAVR